MAEMAEGVGMRLCEAWGLDPARVGRIEIILEPHNVARAKVTIYTEQETSELLRFRLVEEGESDG